MRTYTSITGAGIERVAALAPQLAARGFDGVTTQENRHEPFLPLALASAAAPELELLTNLVIAFPRSPMVTASAAWDLQRLSGGRFHLGLGTQVRGHIVRRFSSTWTQPVAQMRDYVCALRAIFRTWQERVPLDHRSEHYRFDLMTPNFDPGPLACGPPKISIGAIGPAMLRLAATECDGVLLHPVCSPRYLAERTLPLLDETLAAAGRSPAGFTVVGGGFVATGATDADVATAREWVRSRVGFYGSTPAYRPILDHHGLGDLAEQLHHLSKTGGWDRMTPAVGDDALDHFCVAARHDELAAAVERRFGRLVDALSLDADVPPDVLQDVRRVRGRSDRPVT
jgi:probable F420-dependent oxidoreductase